MRRTLRLWLQAAVVWTVLGGVAVAYYGWDTVENHLGTALAYGVAVLMVVGLGHVAVTDLERDTSWRRRRRRRDPWEEEHESWDD